MSGPVLIFDSGIGGLTVFAEVRKVLGGLDFVYIADDAAFPYGSWEDAALSAHILDLMAGLIARFRPSVIVVACNTASTLVLGPLRQRFALPFVGTVPAIKPAAERTLSGLVSVLATPGTMRRDYTRALIASFAQTCHVRLVGSDRLAPLAEAAIRRESVADDEILHEVGPAFMEKGEARTDVIVLACTHFPFLLPVLRRLAPWPVEWIDPAPAIARRVAAVVGEAGEGAVAPARKGVAFLTSGRSWPPAAAELLTTLGLRPAGSGELAL